MGETFSISPKEIATIKKLEVRTKGLREQLKSIFIYHEILHKSHWITMERKRKYSSSLSHVTQSLDLTTQNSSEQS